LDLGPESWIEVTLPDKSIANVKLIKSRRSKRMCIRVDHQGISVLSPVNEDVETIRNFISDNNTWILNKSKFYAKLNNKLEYGPLQKDEIIYLGIKYKIKFVKDTFQYSIFSENLMKITIDWWQTQTKKLLGESSIFGKNYQYLMEK
jgi:predicted metal-dependent hydrolase